jgi:hypothetical protein
MMDWLFGRLNCAGSRCLSVGLATLFVLAASGCSLQTITVNQTADVLWEGRTALESEPDPQFAREALPASLKTVETFLASSPDNEKLLRICAKGYFSYAFAFLEGDLMRGQAGTAEQEELDTLQRRAVIHYMKSHRYGLRLLDNAEFEKAATQLDHAKVVKLLKEMDEDDVPGLFWTAYGWGSAANLAQNNTDLVAALPIVQAIMERTLELDKDFFYSGAHLFFGVYYGSRPPMFGGNPELAKEHFEKATKQDGDKNLLIPALYARFYATAPGVQDRELFERILNEVVERDVQQYPNLRLNNEIAKQRAEFWLDQGDDLFY